MVYITPDVRTKKPAAARACAHDGRGCAGVRMAGGGAALSRVSSRGRLAAPYPTVPYSTVPYCVLPYSRNIRQSISYPVSLKESQGERKPLWETGENVESVWKTCFKALRPLRARARARRSMGACRQGGRAGVAGAFGRAQSGACFRPVRVWWTLLAGALWRPCGAGRGCSAGRAGWLSCREKKCLTSYAKAY